MIKLKSNEILAAEALIRWEHPEWGLISPMEFISLAEETGIIVDIGNWILREVCKNYRMWLSKGMSQILVAVNFSSVQFLENDFSDYIINIIIEYNLDPHFLIMELTESILMQKPDKAAADIKKLQSEGIQIALDDFGTGFSSLAYLSDYNIDILKIDGAFVKKLPADKSSGAIIKSVINLCGDLDIKLVAEGIENWDQLQFLKNLNCNTGQGYIYGKPVPVEEFEKILFRKKLKPVIVSENIIAPMEDRRKFFRVNFQNHLETHMTIMNVKGKKINVGYTAVLIKNIGPGGLCFISNVKLPVQRDFILYFVTEIFNKKFKVYGCPVWMEERKDGLFEYGIEFTFDEKYRTLIIKELSQLQIKMKNDVLFSEGSFTTISPKSYLNV
jgi:EAL domain-containing protein (putative c-di-GMP-specific phosphodiesterase class I)